MKKTIWTYGLISGGILIAAVVIGTMVIGDTGEGGEIFGYTTMVLAFLMVYFGIRSYRDNVGHGVISFGRAFGVGIGITAIACVCYVAAWEVVYHKYFPDFQDKYAAAALAKAKASGATEQQLAEKTKQMEQFKAMYKNPFMNVAMTFVEPFPVGFVITLVCAGVLRKKRPEDEVSTSAVTA